MPKTQKKPIALGVLPERTGFYLRVAQIKIFKHFESLLGELGVSPAIFSAMEILDLNPGITQTKLAKAIHLDHSSMVPLLDKLADRGLILRQTSTTDRRNKMVYLTDAGRELHAQAAAKVDEHESLTTQAVLTPAERQTLIQLLGKLCKDLP